MNKKIKHIVCTFILLLSSLIYFFLAYIGFKNQNINLKKLNKHSGYVESRGLDFHYGSKGRKSKVFFIKLSDLAEKVGVYRMSKDYEDLYQQIDENDYLTVYLKKYTNDSENVNIDLVQIEKNGKVVLNKTEFEKKESNLIYIGLIAGIGTIFLSYLYYKKKFGFPKNVG